MVRIGLIGAGGMGNVHSRQYAKMPDVEVRFFDRNPDHAAKFSQTHGFHAAPSEEALLDWCEMVDIALPTDLHLATTLRALEAGKGVLLEKPMCRTLSECRTLMDTESRLGGWVMPLQVVRYFPEFRRAHEVVQTGVLGRLAAVRMRRGGKAPVGSEGWFRDFDRSGGVLLDLCVHDFDWMRWTVGEVKRVFSRTVVLQGREDVVGDYALTTLEFENGEIGHQEGTWMDPSGFRTTFEVCGSEGMLEHDSRTTKSLLVHTEGGTIGESPMHPLDDPYYLQLRGGIDAFRAGQRPPVSSLDGFMAVAIAQAAIDSARSGAFVSPEKP